MPVLDMVDVARTLLRFVLDARPAVYVAFYLFLLFALYFNRNANVRNAFLGVFFSILLVTSLTGLPFFPFIAWHKFSETYSENEIRHQIRVVDTNEEEIYYDYRAVLDTHKVNRERLEDNMANSYSIDTNCDIASFLLDQAQVYRKSVEQPSIIRFIRFPPHSLSNKWTKRDVKQYEPFVALRLYRIAIQTSDTGSRVTSFEEELLMEYSTNGTISFSGGRNDSSYSCPTSEVTSVVP